ncbi:MAG: hypothetical protein U0703_05055 [Anaerolineae bacterium]
MVDDMIDYLATLRERPVWQPTPGDVKARLQAPLPHEPEGAEAAYADFCTMSSRIRWAARTRASGAG